MATPLQPLNPVDPIDTTTSLDPLNTSCETVSINQQLIGCNSGATALLDSVAENVNDLYGLEINYWRKNFNAKKAHPIWGDQCDAELLGPYCIKAYVNIEDDSSILSQFGMDTTNKIDLQISYAEWRKISTTDSPLAKDIFEIKGLLDCRPSGFTRAIFEVTSQGDGDLFTASKRWFISGQRRDEFNYGVNEPKEVNDSMIFSDDFMGPVDEDGQPLSSAEENPLGRSIDELARENYDNSDCDDVFGGFYD